MTCGATIEVTENDSVIEQHHQIVPMANFDRKGFQEAFDFIELARQAKQIELDEEFEQQQQEELARQAARSFTDKVFGFLFGN